MERLYRGLLRILPTSYREAREEELLSALMNGATEDRRWPELREALSMARLGMRVRLGAAPGGTGTPTRTGLTARAVAIAGTALLAFMGLAQLAMRMGAVRKDPIAYCDWKHPTMVWFAPNRQLSFFDIEVPALWLLVLALITVGWWRAARTLAVGVFLVSLYLSDGTERALREDVLLAGIVTATLFAVRGVHARSAIVPGLVSGLTIVGGAYWLYWSSVWPVALAVIVVAALVPGFIRAAAKPIHGGGDQNSLAFVACALPLIAGLAVFKEWRSGRVEPSAGAS